MTSLATTRTSKHYVDQLKKTLLQHNQLKNDLQSQKLINLGLYQQASQQQKPITDILTKTAESTDMKLELIKKTIENENELSRQRTNNNNEIVPKVTNENEEDKSNSIPLDFNSSGTSYSLINTNEILTDQRGTKFNIYKFNSDAESNNGKWILFSKGGDEMIWDYKFESQPIILTAGLKEIFFNDAVNREVITSDDIHNWIELMKKSGLGSFYRNTNVYKNLKSLIPPIQEGKGLKTDPITIPSDPYVEN
jgi:hypothetical protein